MNCPYCNNAVPPGATQCPACAAPIAASAPVAPPAPPQQTQQYQQTYQQPQYAPPPQPPPGGIICPNPNCRYVGPGKTTGGMNCLVFLVLLLLGFIPALIYLLVCPKEEVHCPRCGTKIR